MVSGFELCGLHCTIILPIAIQPKAFSLLGGKSPTYVPYCSAEEVFLQLYGRLASPS